jgi:AcrR family transcriptional regulator
MASARKKTEIRKSEIIEAAQELIYREGSEHVTVRNIAKQVQISEAAVYRHFKSKREILSFLAQCIRDTLMGDLSDEIDPGQDALDHISELLNRHLAAIQKRNGNSFLVLAEILSLGQKELYQEMNDLLKQYIDRLKQLLAIGVRAGQLRADLDLDSTALMLFGTIQGLVSLWALGGHGFDLVKRYADIWQELKKGLAIPYEAFACSGPADH